MLRLSLVLLTACELSPLNVETGTLEKLRIVQVSSSQDFTEIELHVVDKAKNPRDVKVRIGVCVDNECPVTRPIKEVQIEEGTATRLGDCWWSYRFSAAPFFAAEEVPPARLQAVQQPRAYIYAEADDGVQSDRTFVSLHELFTERAPFTIGITEENGAPVEALAPKGRYVVMRDPPGATRWYVSANALVTERKAPRTTIELVRAVKGERVYVFAVGNGGVGAFSAAAFDVR